MRGPYPEVSVVVVVRTRTSQRPHPLPLTERTRTSLIINYTTRPKAVMPIKRVLITTFYSTTHSECNTQRKLR